MSQEAIEYFSEATIGKDQLVQRDPRNPHRFYDAPARQYNAAVGAEMDKFIAENHISAENKMTKDQAKKFVDRILESEVPEIKGYNRPIQRYIMKRYLRGTSPLMRRKF